MDKNWQTNYDKWLLGLQPSSRNDLFKILGVLKNQSDQLGRDSFEIPYEEFHKKDIEGSVQNWLKNLHSRGLITIWNNENKVNGEMAFSVSSTYDSKESEHIYPYAKIELHTGKIDYLYSSIKITTTSDPIEKDNSAQSPFLLAIPDNKSCRVPKGMAKLLFLNSQVSYYELARSKYSQLSLNKFGSQKKDYKKEIRNALRTIKKYWKRFDYSIKAITRPIEGYRFIQKTNS